MSGDNSNEHEPLMNDNKVLAVEIESPGQQ